MNRRFNDEVNSFGLFALATGILLVSSLFAFRSSGRVAASVRDQQAADEAVLARVPMRVLANAPYIDARINDHGPFTFGLDTGSMNSPPARELAETMGFDSRPTVRTGQPTVFTIGSSTTLSTIKASFTSFANLWALPGTRIYGDIGQNALKDFVVEFDYAGGIFTVYDPKRFEYRGGGTVLPVTWVMNYDPQIDGEILVPGLPPIKTKFTLDTGAGGTVISAPLVSAHDLSRHVVATMPAPRSAPLADGVNGIVFDTVTARIAAIRIGPYDLKRPLVALSRDTQGTFAMAEVGVNLGGNVRRRFKVIVDYPHQRVILEPNARLHDPFPADASGLVLTATGDDFKTFIVHGVVPKSPADEAGFREEDVITAIDGEPATTYALWQIQDLFKDASRARRVTITRAGATLTKTIKLRPLA